MKMSRAILLLAVVGVLAASLGGCSSSAGPRDQRLAQIRSVCGAMGTQPGEAPFTVCVDNLKQTAPMEPAALLANRGVRYVQPADNGNDVHRGAERACFDVGLNPKTEPYWTCVNTLDLAMTNIDMVGTR
jgi:hypothetical protein